MELKVKSEHVWRAVRSAYASRQWCSDKWCGASLPDIRSPVLSGALQCYPTLFCANTRQCRHRLDSAQSILQYQCLTQCTVEGIAWAQCMIPDVTEPTVTRGTRLQSALFLANLDSSWARLHAIAHHFQRLRQSHRQRLRHTLLEAWGWQRTLVSELQSNKLLNKYLLTHREEVCMQWVCRLHTALQSKTGATTTVHTVHTLYHCLTWIASSYWIDSWIHSMEMLGEIGWNALLVK